MSGLRTGKDGSQAFYLLLWIFILSHRYFLSIEVCLTSRFRQNMLQLQLLPPFLSQESTTCTVVYGSQRNGGLLQVHVSNLFPRLSWSVSLSVILFCSLPVIFMCWMYHLWFCSGQMISKNIQGPWFLCSLAVYKMDLWNENPVSHMNLLTPVIFYLLPTAVLKIRFSEECMDFCIFKGFFLQLLPFEMCPVQWQKGYFCN